MENILSVEQSTISSQDLPKYGYVYITENLINHKKYIGVHKASCFDETYKGSGKILWRAINKYGWDNFKTEIIKWCYSKEELFKEEFLEIEKRNAVESPEYYNIMVGGHGGDNKTSLSPEEHKQFVEKSRKSNLGQVRSDEAKRHMSENHADFNGEKNPFYGRHHSEETKRKISENHSDTSGKNNPMYGKKHSEESIRKMSEAHSRISKGRIWMTNKIDEEYMITPSEYEEYISKGYVRGRLRKTQKFKLGR